MGNTLYSPSASLYSTQDYKIGTRELWGKPDSMTGRGGAGLVQSNNPQSNTEKYARDNLPSHPSRKEFNLGHSLPLN